MSFEFGTRTDYDKGIFRTTWTWWPEDTLEALDLMLVYLGVNDSLVRPQEVIAIRRDSNIKAKLHRALHDKAIRSAIRLIGPGRKCSNSRRAICWYVTPTFDVKGRLRSAGLDINTLNIIDHRRWAFAWHQLSYGNVIVYSAPENDRLTASAHETPPVEPVVKQVTTTFAKGQGPAKVAFKFQKKNNFIHHDGKRVYDPRAAQERQDAFREANGPLL